MPFIHPSGCQGEGENPDKTQIWIVICTDMPIAILNRRLISHEKHGDIADAVLKKASPLNDEASKPRKLRLWYV